MKGMTMSTRWFVGLLAVGTCLTLLGCGASPAGSVDSQIGPAQVLDDHADAHDHDAPGPHGGHLIVLGEEEFHAELTHDEASHTVSIYLLDSTGKEPVSSEQESITLQVFKDGDFIEYVLKATGNDGVFSAVDEQLRHLLLHDVKGRLHATIAGKEYVGMVELASHEHAEHSHEHSGHGHERESEAHGEDGHEHEKEASAHDHNGHAETH
jgi:hypothetical protein